MCIEFSPTVIIGHKNIFKLLRHFNPSKKGLNCHDKGHGFQGGELRLKRQ